MCLTWLVFGVTTSPEISGLLETSVSSIKPSITLLRAEEPPRFVFQVGCMQLLLPPSVEQELRFFPSRNVVIFFLGRLQVSLFTGQDS